MGLVLFLLKGQRKVDLGMIDSNGFPTSFSAIGPMEKSELPARAFWVSPDDN